MNFLSTEKTLGTIFSPAKINMFLAVAGRRQDGYHNLFSANILLNFCDELTLYDAIKPEDIFFCDQPLLDKKNNTVLTALDLFRQKTKTAKFFKVSLKKKIPIEGGFGGGSSNAAAALMLANRVHNSALTYQELRELSSEIGSDCPLFLKNKPSIMEGRGEKLADLDEKIIQALGDYRFLIFKPPFGTNTAKAYSTLAGQFSRFYMPESEIREKFSALAEAIKSRQVTLPFFNTFSEIFFTENPDFKILQEKLKDLGINMSLTGSGSGFFCAAHKSVDLEKAKSLIREMRSGEMFLHPVGMFVPVEKHKW